MTASAKQRHQSAYRAALEDIKTENPEAAEVVDDYVYWLLSQIKAKRQNMQALMAEVEQMGGGYDQHRFRYTPADPVVPEGTQK